MTLIVKMIIQQFKSYKKNNVIFIGINAESVYLSRYIDDKKKKQYINHGFFSNKENDKFNVIGSKEAALEYIKKNKVDSVFIAFNKITIDYYIKISDFCENNFIQLYIIPDGNGIIERNLEKTFIDNIPLLQSKEKPLNQHKNKITKRFFDVIFSLSIILFIFSWLFPILAILIKLSSKGPVFFKQKRTGYLNEDFYCFKFRTMKMNESSNQKQATKNDDRITKIGAFLRKTSIDELPQFFNVLIGNMSVVGPRPHMLKHTKEYTELIPTYLQRHKVKPGITGLAQILGYRGETEHDLHLMKMRVRMDRFYIDNWTLYLDIKIIYATVISVFKPKTEVY